MPVEGPPLFSDKAAFCAALERGDTVKSVVSFKFAKIDEAKRLVTAWASVVSKADGSPIVDHQGDVIDIENLDEAFIEAFADGGFEKGGTMHETQGGADIVGQIVLSRADRVALGFGLGPEGAIVKIRVTDDALWDRVRSGELSEISIEGEGTREEIAA